MNKTDRLEELCNAIANDILNKMKKAEEAPPPMIFTLKINGDLHRLPFDTTSPETQQTSFKPKLATLDDD